MSEINVDPMKKSSIYATFGRYYGEKLYKLLYDCCSGRPGSFCYEVLSCLGISSQGDSSKFLNQQGNWEYVSGSEPIEVIYTELINLISTNSLIPGKQYLITDFKTVHYIQFSGGGIGSEDIHTGTTEPMVVQAVSNSELAAEIWSTVYPEDEITWKPIFVDREWDAVLGESTGIITSRYDTINKLYRDYDFRNIVFRRWETTSGSGVYDSVTPTAFAYQDFPPFSNTGAFNVLVGSALNVSVVFGFPYFLDNVVFLSGSFNVNVEVGVNITCLSFCANSTINLLGNTLFSNSVSGNLIGQCFINTFGGKLDDNMCTFLNYNVIGGDFAENNINMFNDNDITGTVSNNIGTDYFNNSTTVPNSNMSFNNVSFIGGNEEFDDISYNTGISINNNINCKIENNNVLTIYSNEGLGLGIMSLKYNTANNISSNTTSSAGTFTFERNNINDINTNNFSGLTSFDHNIGNDFNTNIFGSLATKFSDNKFGKINSNTIQSDIQNNMFMSNIITTTFSGTSGMQSNNPSVTLFDLATGNVEQVLSGGVITYNTF